MQIILRFGYVVVSLCQQKQIIMEAQNISEMKSPDQNQNNEFQATLISSENTYLQYPCRVMVRVLEFGWNDCWIQYIVAPYSGNGVWVTARSAKFENIFPLHRRRVNGAAFIKDNSESIPEK